MYFKVYFSHEKRDEVQSPKYFIFDIPLKDIKYFTIFESLVFKKYLFYKTIRATTVHSWCTFER